MLPRLCVRINPTCIWKACSDNGFHVSSSTATGEIVSWISGYSTPADERKQATTSNWFEAQMPSCRINQRMPARALPKRRVCGQIETGFKHRYFRTKSGWSIKFWPTPGESITMGISSFLRWDAGPIPDNISNWGLPTAPALSTTSRRAVASITLPSAVLYWTPVAVISSSKIFWTWALVIISRFSRPFTGSR